jgi:D-alanine-D-alanine ligase
MERTEGAAPAVSDSSVAVLMGGRSGEREVSLVTGQSVLGALQTTQLPNRPRQARGIEILADGRWRAMSAGSGATASARGIGEALSPCAALEALAEVDVFFIGLHGGEGEDGTMQGLLELAGRRFTGSGVRASALCMDKQASRMLAAGEGLAVAAGLAFGEPEWRENKASLLHRMGGMGSRWFVKPRCGGSSVATFLVASLAELPGAIERVLASGDEALVERRVEGVELSCGVLGNADEPGHVLPPIEIQPCEGRFFDYQQKYASDGAREICPPDGVGPEVVARVQQAALRMHRVAGCDGYSRSDFIATAAGEVVLLELNTLPGLTPRSLLPQEAAAAGIPYDALCLQILERGLRARARVQP